MNTEDMSNRPAFTKQFIGEVVERFEGSIEHVLKVYGLPEVEQAKNTLTMLHLFIMCDPDKLFPPGITDYNQELIATLQDASWHIEKMDEMAKAKYRLEKA